MSSTTGFEVQLWEIAEKGQFAVLLDITTPKPGNVHRYRDHPDTRFIHFAASISRLGYPLYLAATNGYLNHQNSESNPFQLGESIKLAVQRTMELHDRNTLLGTILLLIPLAMAAGYQVSIPRLTPPLLQQGLTAVLQQTTVEDAVELIRTLQIAKPGGSIPQTPDWTSKQQAFNYQSPHTIALIRKEGYTLRDLQTLAASYDAIAQEYTNNFEYLFTTLYPAVIQALNRYPHIEQAVLVTYLWALSKSPDTFIQRKAGLEVAKQVQQKAKDLYNRITHTPNTRWLELLEPFDQYLHSKGSHLNPGTTADLLSGAIYIALLVGDITSVL